MKHSSRALTLVFVLAASLTAAHAQPAPPRTDAALPPVKTLGMMAAAIPCSDLDRSLAFYTKGLGMTSAGKVEMGSVTEAPVMFPGGGTYLMLLHPKTAASPLPTSAICVTPFSILPPRSPPDISPSCPRSPAW